jgi:ribonuclease HI
MYFDGSLMKTRAGAGLLFISPLGVHMRYVIWLHFAASNNVIEYEALVKGLRIAIELGVRHLDVHGDSHLVSNHVMKSSSYRDPKMEAYCEKVRCLEDKFHNLELNHIARIYNEAVDELVKIASSRATVPPDVFMRDLHQSSVNTREDGGADSPSLDPPPKAEAPSTGTEVMQAEGSTPLANLEPNWHVPYLNHLTRGGLPLDKTEARQIARRSKTFVIFGDNKELYRRSPTGILQCCITNEEGKNLLKDLHSGACGHHAAPRTLIGNAF